MQVNVITLRIIDDHAPWYTPAAVVAEGFGIPIMFPAPSYVGVARAVPTEFVMPVISFTLSAVVAWTFLSESSPEDMADTEQARTTTIYLLANGIGQSTDMNVHPTFNRQKVIDAA